MGQIKLKNGKYGLLIKDNKPTSINTFLIEVIENYKFYKLKSIAGFKDIKNITLISLRSIFKKN